MGFNDTLHQLLEEYNNEQNKYDKRVESCLINVIMGEENISEKDFSGVDKAKCKARRMVEDANDTVQENEEKGKRPELCAELIYDKCNRTASGKKYIKLSKNMWKKIGKQAGWMRTAAYKKDEFDLTDPSIKNRYLDRFGDFVRVDEDVINEATRVEVWCSSFKKPGEDYNEFRFFKDDELIHKEHVPGY